MGFTLYTGNEWVWVKHLSLCEFALSCAVTASTGKATFKLVYAENVTVPLDHLTGATQLSHVQVAGEMAEEVSRLVDAAKT